MAAKHFMHEAFSNAHGQLHRELGVPLKDKIPVEKLRKASHSKNPKERHRAQLVLNADHPLR